MQCCVWIFEYLGGVFDTDWFFEHFCNEPHVHVEDIIDLLVFLQQTAFDRQFGFDGGTI